VFDPYRDAMKERVLNQMQRKRQHEAFSNGFPNASSISKFQLKIDKADAYDYENPEKRKYSKEEVKLMII